MIDKQKMGETLQVLEPLLVFRKEDHSTGGIKRGRRLNGCALGLGKGRMDNAYGFISNFSHVIFDLPFQVPLAAKNPKIDRAAAGVFF
jgi:hypothetical protein